MAHNWTVTSQKWAQQAKSFKPPELGKGFGVKMDIDVLNPLITAVKTNWDALPEPVKQVAPFAGTALIAGALTGALYREQLKSADARLERLKHERADLQQRLADLERQVGGRAAAMREAQLAEALGRAATAAAAAAGAAATAAQAATLPAYEPAKAYALLQQLGGASGLPYYTTGPFLWGGVGPAAGVAALPPPQQLAQGQRRRHGRGGKRGEDGGSGDGGDGGLWAALPWGGGGGGWDGQRRGRRGGGGVVAEDSEVEWSDLPTITSGSEADASSAAAAAPAAAAAAGATATAAALDDEGRRAKGGGPLEGLRRAAAAPLAAVAGALQQAPSTLAKVPGWLGEQAGRAKEQAEKLFGGSSGSPAVAAANKGDDDKRKEKKKGQKK